jgi:hypothetical protein
MKKWNTWGQSKMTIKYEPPQKRGCGYRKLHKLYLVGGGLRGSCDRLPLKIIECNVCGGTINFSRGIQKVDLSKMYGDHNCTCHEQCPICHPSKLNEVQTWLMWVGKSYTQKSFIKECEEMGASKAIPFVPKGFIVNQDWVLLAMKGIVKEEKAFHPRRKIKKDAIFYAYMPDRIDYLITEEEAADLDFVMDLESRGITAVVVVDGDKNHLPKEPVKKKYQPIKSVNGFFEAHPEMTTE